ncbi:MAG: peptidylprolyl isomerase [Bacteroidota bacterium]
MATLEKIRNRAGVLIAIVIGLALVAFILGDMLTAGGSALFSRDRYEVGEVRGKSISYEEFLNEYEELANIYRMNTGQTSLDQQTTDFVREQTWQNMVDDIVLGREYDKLGLGVSARELFEIIQGPNPHAIVRQMFTDPQTGQVNRSQLLAFWRSLSEDPNQERLALARFIEESILREQLNTKYTALIQKGLYVTNQHARQEYIENNKSVDFEYVSKPFQSVPDTAVTVTDRELKDYYKEHQQEYKQEETRDLEYVIFNIEPTEEDVQFALEEIEEIKEEFQEVPDAEVEQFVRFNSDEPYRARNFVDGELPAAINDTMFMISVGDVVGPYREGEAYKLAKLVEINYLPDSIHARHILIQPTREMDYQQAYDIADSLKTIIQTGADFASLALEHSADQGSAADGGDLGWFREGMMVKPFNDTVFTAEVNEVKLIESDFGIHIAQVIEKSRDVKKVHVARVERTIEPSRETINNVYSQANEFGANNRTHESFNQTVQEQGLNKRIASNLRTTDRTISGLENPRPMIQWAFDAEEGDVSDIFELGDNYVVAALSEVRPEGIAPFEQVAAEIQLNVLKQKKGALIAEQIKTANAGTLNELAGNMALDIKNAGDITFSSFSLPGAGVEPKVIGVATSLEQGILSEPIIGTNAVYVLQVTNVDEAEPTEQDIAMQKMRIQRAYETRANREPKNALHEKADIEDRRIKFF